MANSSDVDAAVCAVLASDPALAAVCPDGVFFDIAPNDKNKFVVVSLVIHQDTYEFQDAAWETFTYKIRAITVGKSGADVKQAAQRIHAVLQDTPITVNGYHWMRCQRTEYIRLTIVDEDTDARWQTRGGHYELWMQPINAPTIRE